MDINFYIKSMESFIILSVMWYERLTQMLPIAHWPVRVQGIGEDMLSNMLSFINFELLELYWTYFLALQTTILKILPIRLMSLDQEPKIRWCVMSLNHGFWRLFLCKYGLFWALDEILQKFMIVLTWCRLPMKWSHVVWKICSQQWATRPVKRRQTSGGDEIEMTRDRSRGRRWRDPNYMIWSAISAVWFGVRAVVQFGVVIFPISFTPETNTALV